METRSIPKNALRFNVGQCEFGDNGANSKTAPFKMNARTGDYIDHWYWGKVVHDMQGLKLNKPRIGIDYNHNADEVLGWANKFDTSTGDLIASGTIQSVKDGDRASEVIERGKNGQPYEASIFFGDDVVCEEVPEGKTAFVNGRELTGNALIIRQWSLRGIAVCPYGADPNTSTAFADKTDTVKVQFITSGENKMSEAVEAVEETAVETDQNKLGEVQPMTEAEASVDSPEVEANVSVTVVVDAVAAVETGCDEDEQEEEEADTPAVETSEPQTELGAKPVEGHATELSVDASKFAALEKENGELKSELATLNSRLKALGALGEQKPVTFQAVPEKESDLNQAKFTKLKKAGHSDATAAFAASVKLPTK